MEHAGSDEFKLLSRPNFRQMDSLRCLVNLSMKEYADQMSAFGNTLSSWPALRSLHLGFKNDLCGLSNVHIHVPVLEVLELFSFPDKWGGGEWNDLPVFSAPNLLVLDMQRFRKPLTRRAVSLALSWKLLEALTLVGWPNGEQLVNVDDFLSAIANGAWPGLQTCTITLTGAVTTGLFSAFATSEQRPRPLTSLALWARTTQEEHDSALLSLQAHIPSVLLTSGEFPPSSGPKA